MTRLTFVKDVERISKHRRAMFNCVCGATKIIRYDGVQSGAVRSCGCYQKEVAKQLNLKHGHAFHSRHSRTYTSWVCMKTRCFNPRHKNYGHYGGRGIVVCKRWMKFENFLKDMGKRPENRTLDRINVNGNYTPSNCRWATSQEQGWNKRCHH